MLTLYRTRRSPFTLMLISFFLLVIGAQAFACRHVARKPEVHVNQAAYVFIARITSLKEIKNSGRGGSVQAGFDIKRVLKGDPNNLRYLYSGYGFGDCGLTFAIGNQYLIFTSDNGAVTILNGSHRFIEGNLQHKSFIDQIAQYVRSGKRIKIQFSQLNKPYSKKTIPEKPAVKKRRRIRSSAIGGPAKTEPKEPAAKGATGKVKKSL